jgi:hypothetical protein
VRLLSNGRDNSVPRCRFCTGLRHQYGLHAFRQSIGGGLTCENRSVKICPAIHTAEGGATFGQPNP